jgi:pyruvate dehydrogenase E2 component (dihydrolipoamide acetyltransferase)
MISLTLLDAAWEDVADGTEALLDEWLVTVGDQVVADQVLARVVVVKTSCEILAPTAGTISAILVAAGDTFAKGAPIAHLAPALSAAEAMPTPTLPVPIVEPVATPTATQLIPLSGLRGIIARNLSAAWQAPQVAVGVDVDLTLALARLETLRTEHPTAKITLTSLLIRATANALRAHPAMNALLTPQGIELVPTIHLALAVSTADGLLTPVIQNADQLSIVALAHEAARLAEATRAGTLPPGAFQGGTFTLTNLGMAGIDWFTPVLNPPQIGILGVGQIVQKPLARDAQVVIAPVATLTLVFDHRAVDGYPAALFLADLARRLQTAAEL